MSVPAVALTLALASAGIRPANECVPHEAIRATVNPRIQEYDSLLRRLALADRALVTGQSRRADGFLPTSSTYAPVWQELQENSRPAEVLLVIESTKWVSKAKGALREYDTPAARRDIARAEAALRRARQDAGKEGAAADDGGHGTRRSLLGCTSDDEPLA
jgi:hypothetical protein